MRVLRSLVAMLRPAPTASAALPHQSTVARARSVLSARRRQFGKRAPASRGASKSRKSNRTTGGARVFCKNQICLHWEIRNQADRCSCCFVTSSQPSTRNTPARCAPGVGRRRSHPVPLPRLLVLLKVPLAPPRSSFGIRAPILNLLSRCCSVFLVCMFKV